MHGFIHSYIHINALRWHHNGRDCISNHRAHDCSLNRLFRRRSKKTSKLRVAGLWGRGGGGGGAGDWFGGWGDSRLDIIYEVWCIYWVFSELVRMINGGFGWLILDRNLNHFLSTIWYMLWSTRYYCRICAMLTYSVPHDIWARFSWVLSLSPVCSWLVWFFTI